MDEHEGMLWKDVSRFRFRMPLKKTVDVLLKTGLTCQALPALPVRLNVLMLSLDGRVLVFTCPFWYTPCVGCPHGPAEDQRSKKNLCHCSHWVWILFYIVTNLFHFFLNFLLLFMVFMTVTVWSRSWHTKVQCCLNNDHVSNIFYHMFHQVNCLCYLYGFLDCRKLSNYRGRETHIFCYSDNLCLMFDVFKNLTMQNQKFVIHEGNLAIAIVYSELSNCWLFVFTIWWLLGREVFHIVDINCTIYYFILHCCVENIHCNGVCHHSGMMRSSSSVWLSPSWTTSVPRVWTKYTLAVNKL